MADAAPSLKECDLKIEALTKVVDERDRLYHERDEFRAAQFESALAAAAEASRKTELAQEKYNLLHNNLIEKGDVQAREILTRCQEMLDGLRREIDVNLKHLTEGRTDQRRYEASASRDWTAMAVAGVVSIMAFLAGWLLR